MLKQVPARPMPISTAPALAQGFLPPGPRWDLGKAASPFRGTKIPQLWFHSDPESELDEVEPLLLRVKKARGKQMCPASCCLPQGCLETNEQTLSGVHPPWAQFRASSTPQKTPRVVQLWSQPSSRVVPAPPLLELS